MLYHDIRYPDVSCIFVAYFMFRSCSYLVSKSPSPSIHILLVVSYRLFKVSQVNLIKVQVFPHKNFITMVLVRPSEYPSIIVIVKLAKYCTVKFWCRVQYLYSHWLHP